MWKATILYPIWTFHIKNSLTSVRVEANIREKAYTKTALFEQPDRINCQLFRQHVKKSDIYLAKVGDLTTAAETI
jgi:hypothetical protein